MVHCKSGFVIYMYICNCTLLDGTIKFHSQHTDIHVINDGTFILFLIRINSNMQVHTSALMLSMQLVVMETGEAQEQLKGEEVCIWVEVEVEEEQETVEEGEEVVEEEEEMIEEGEEVVEEGEEVVEEGEEMVEEGEEGEVEDLEVGKVLKLQVMKVMMMVVGSD